MSARVQDENVVEQDFKQVIRKFKTQRSQAAILEQYNTFNPQMTSHKIN